MNKTDLKAIKEVFGNLEIAKDTLEALATQQREAFEAKSERVQRSSAGEQQDAEATELETAVEYIDSALNCLGNIGGLIDG